MTQDDLLERNHTVDTASIPSAPTILQAREAQLAPYATLASQSRGRLYNEPAPEARSHFQRDRDRIVHSTAFRRLEYKTQVFVNHEGDHYRTRLTHSIEVAQLSRSIARELALDEDLAEAQALAHDLGHTPFGHAGEDALHEVMQPFGGFDHNAHTIRVLTHIEDRYASFVGLNLTWETLEGLAKHNGPLMPSKDDRRGLPWALDHYDRLHELELWTWPGLEAQVAAIADDIAYNNHDIDDGLRAGLFSMADVLELPLIGDTFREIRARFPKADDYCIVHESIRRIIHAMVTDVVEESRRRIVASDVQSAAEVRLHDGPLIGFSTEMQDYNRVLKEFLFTRMYRHYRVNRMTSKARRVIFELFTLLLSEPECLPPNWRVGQPESNEAARAVADYIAGMTDRFAMQEYHRLFDLSATL